MSSLPRLALASAGGFVDLVRADAISRPKSRLGRCYRVDRGGVYEVFREMKNYLGIYQWAGEKNARPYAEALCRVLRSLSTRDSVWYDFAPEQKLDPYLAARAA